MLDRAVIKGLGGQQKIFRFQTGKAFLNLGMAGVKHKYSPLGMEVSRATAVSYVQQRATLRMV